MIDTRGPAYPIVFGLLVVASGLVGTRGMAQQPLRVTAIAGQPFGVARIEMPATVADALAPGRDIQISSDQGRIHYPVSREIQITVREPVGPVLLPQRGRRLGRGRLLRRLGNAIRNATAEKNQRTVGNEIWFLFQGDQPLTVQISGYNTGPISLIPERFDTQPLRGMIDQWWQAYCRAAQKRIDQGDHPPLVETYLVSTLGRRLGLQPVGDRLQAMVERSNQVTSTLEMIAGTEKLRTAIFQRAATGDTEPILANLPLPASPNWIPTDVPIAKSNVKTEPIAKRVPPECFYIRFGSFANYQWFSDLSSRFGGDISRMITLRGFGQIGNQRTEKQLNLKVTNLTRIFGPSVIDDQAIIGSDLFISEGASLGVLMKAKSPLLLKTSLNSERTSAAKQTKAASLVEENIAGRTVTFLSTPDNRIRSFLAIDGSWFFVTNSRTLVRRFYEMADGQPSLAETNEFCLARTLMPLKRNDTLFAYFSSAMLRELVGPEYQIELRRRLFSSADISMIHMARLAAQGEGYSIDSIKSLIDQGYLPVGFGRRPDGSGPIVWGNHVTDSRRGGRGTFLPIADTKIETVTAEEAAWYQRRADYYNENWQQMDPIMLGVQRAAVHVEGRPHERLQIHAEIAPLVAEKYGTLAQQLGPPTRVALQFAPDDIVAVQAHVVSDQLNGSIPPHHLFAAIKDSVLPNAKAMKGLLKTYVALHSVPGYLGAWPKPGLLDRLPLGLGRGTPVSPDMNRLIGGIYRYQRDGFSVLSFQPNVLTASAPFWNALDTDNEAQIRARIDNLVGTRLEGWVNTRLYERARETSLAGASFLNSLSSQLRVDPEHALTVTKDILGVGLQCPLGGQYIPTQSNGVTIWNSTAWKETLPSVLPPPDYRAPVLEWFRGLRANLTQYPDRLVADLSIDTEDTRSNQVAPKKALKETKGSLPNNQPSAKQRLTIP